MKMYSRIAMAVLACALPLAVTAQVTIESSAPMSQTTLNNGTGTPITKDELKAQRKAQKAQEKAANSNAKAAKSQANAKKAQDKALQDQENANGTVPKN